MKIKNKMLNHARGFAESKNCNSKNNNEKLSTECRMTYDKTNSEDSLQPVN